MNAQVKPHTIATAKHFGVTIYNAQGQYAAKFMREELLAKHGGSVVIHHTFGERYRLEHWS